MKLKLFKRTLVLAVAGFSVSAYPYTGKPFHGNNGQRFSIFSGIIHTEKEGKQFQSVKRSEKDVIFQEKEQDRTDDESGINGIAINRERCCTSRIFKL